NQLFGCKLATIYRANLFDEISEVVPCRRTGLKPFTTLREKEVRGVLNCGPPCYALLHQCSVFRIETLPTGSGEHDGCFFWIEIFRSQDCCLTRHNETGDRQYNIERSKGIQIVLSVFTAQF